MHWVSCDKWDFCSTLIEAILRSPVAGVISSPRFRASTTALSRNNRLGEGANGESVPAKGMGHRRTARIGTPGSQPSALALPERTPVMRHTLKSLGIVSAIVLSSLVGVSGVASADPSANDWLKVRQCESGNRYNINTGNGYYGAYQFDLSTWKSVGGTGYPHEASASEQDYRALRLYRMRGWSPWICAGLVGVTNDSDAKSGVIPPSNGFPSGGSTGGSTGGGSTGGGSTGGGSTGGSGSSGSSTAPAYPGKQLHLGDSSEALKKWQKQMGKLGYGLTGTGYFGPKTKAAVLKIQREQGLNVVGFIGPKTWAAAWKKKASTGSSGSGSSGSGSSGSGSSGYTPATNKTCSVGASTAPAYPGGNWKFGDVAQKLQCFQRQLGHRGYGLTGTGYYGSSTKAVVLALQKRNGIAASGVVNAATWKAAWQGM